MKEILLRKPYSTTIVNQVVETHQPLLTNNAQFDTRYKAGQSIIMKGLRAILCAPMLVKDRLVGVVYVDTSIRTGTFKESDLFLLSAVAGQAAIAIENARLYGVAVEKGRMERELQMARDIQQSLLPRRMPQLPGYEIAARWQSAREVAGDFYDVFALPDDTLGLVIADVSDKGAPAALVHGFGARHDSQSRAGGLFALRNALPHQRYACCRFQRRYVCDGLLHPVSVGRRGDSRQRWA